MASVAVQITKTLVDVGLAFVVVFGFLLCISLGTLLSSYVFVLDCYYDEIMMYEMMFETYDVTHVGLCLVI